ncbi:unnamed protein product [Cyclocybe aegerita]|uniref:Protein PBN1 n=1 Tax=Cyclocybe aegerita TaxID=1973307 RepID=A0A8S0X4W8_CYCAE|nr:unnamed protein product [Cyclocybe aegerita]
MAYLTSRVHSPQGFHPTFTTSIHSPLQLLVSGHNLTSSCTLHLLYTLPPGIFVDRHELALRHNQYTFIHWGSRDLERPVGAVEASEVLISVPEPGGVELEKDDGQGEVEVRVEVPMHLRYGRPRKKDQVEGREERERGGKPYQEICVDWPMAFLSCPRCSDTDCLSSQVTPPSPTTIPLHVLSSLTNQSTHTLIPINPHPSFNVTFNHRNHTCIALLLPVGDASDLALVEILTTLTMLACFFKRKLTERLRVYD